MNKATTCVHSSFDVRKHDYCPDCGETDTFRVMDERHISRLEAENARLRQALRDVIQHQNVIGGSLSAHSATVAIARAVLGGDE